MISRSPPIRANRTSSARRCCRKANPAPSSAAAAMRIAAPTPRRDGRPSACTCTAASSTITAPTPKPRPRGSPSSVFWRGSTVASAAFRSQRYRRARSGEAALEHATDHLLQAFRAFGQPGEAVLVHVGGLHELKLHGLDALFGPPVVARDVAALEAAIDHVRVLRLCRHHGGEAILQGRRAARTSV